MDKPSEKTEALNNSKQLLDELVPSIGELAMLYHQEDKKIALRETDKLLQKLMSLTASMNNSESIQVTEIKKIDPILAEMIHSLENSDYVLLSDLLEYELLPLVNKWRKQIIYRGATL